MFLFSATFYPLSTYPVGLRWVVTATPLHHAVALIRSLTLGEVGWPVRPGVGARISGPDQRPGSAGRASAGLSAGIRRVGRIEQVFGLL
jgi:hypothetical protein